MQARLCFLGIIACLLALAWQPEDVGSHDRAMLLGRVTLRMRENLKSLPNYTCLQTIERSRRPSTGQKYQLIDRVRIEVGLVDGKEVFSWPGARRFEDKELKDIVLGGAIGNGNFALHARAVFMSGSPNFTFAGERIYDGRQTWRWDFTVPKFRSGYTLRNGTREAVVGYHGSFWADTATLDVVRLEVHADDIPAHLEIAAADDAVEYARIRIGERDFLLPRRSELRLTDYAGENRNAIDFSTCRQYTGESVISFDDAPGESSTARAAAADVQLPADLDLILMLQDHVKADTAAVGDSIDAVVRANVKHRGTLLVPKGAVAKGRVLWLRQQREAQSSYVIGLEFSELLFANGRAPLRARLTEILGARNTVDLVPPGLNRLYGARATMIAGDLVNMPGVLFARPGQVLLPRGLQMLWRTQVMTEDTK